VSCADDLWDDWELEPPGVDPDDDPPLELLGPHMWIRRRWRPIEDAPGIDDYQQA